MSFLDLTEIGLLRDLQGIISNVSFDGLGKDFRRQIDMQIVSGLYGFAATSEARDAAAELARDCSALAEDLALAGAKPSPAWDEAIESDRRRAGVSLERLAASLSTCLRLDPKTGKQRTRPGSVPIRRKSFYRPEP
jgi:hypothetical protein